MDSKPINERKEKREKQPINLRGTGRPREGPEGSTRLEGHRAARTTRQCGRRGRARSEMRKTTRSCSVGEEGTRRSRSRSAGRVMLYPGTGRRARVRTSLSRSLSAGSARLYMGGAWAAWGGQCSRARAARKKRRYRACAAWAARSGRPDRSQKHWERSAANAPESSAADVVVGLIEGWQRDVVDCASEHVRLVWMSLVGLRKRGQWAGVNRVIALVYV